MFFAKLLSCCFLALCAPAVHASLRGRLHASVGSMSTEQLRETVLQEVMAALGSGNRVTQERLKSIEDAARSSFQAMPKNEHGNLEDAAARYMLHRLFVQRHAMYIKGLEANGMDWQNASTSQVLQDHVPSFVLSLFEDRLKGQGLGLHELTVLAATLEHLIHDEAVSRLSVVYQAHNISEDAVVDEKMLQEIIDTYMTIFLAGRSDVSAASVASERAAIAETYPGWYETQKFTMQVRSNLVASKASDPNFAPNNLSFHAATTIVEAIGERYGRWQDAECRDLKRSLTSLEHGGTGRVLLKDFYGSALKGNWQFSESIAYLKELGALDESDPKNLAVLIPNYVNSQSNCVASSSVYSVCCINECESLMGHLEREIAAPEASAEMVLSIVSKLASDTVSAPRILSEELKSRLQDVAKEHNGKVPLHGRLFAQWLHHAYPRECPFPHVGKTNPMTADEWMQTRQQSVSASKYDMQRVIQMQARSDANLKVPWVSQEQLLSTYSQDSSGGPSLLHSFTFMLMAFCACISFAYSSLATGKGSMQRSSILPCYKEHACWAFRSFSWVERTGRLLWKEDIWA